ncbi:MAG: N-acetylmuramic acid 6-phosphate etherase [Leadbetterella sp.]
MSDTIDLEGLSTEATSNHSDLDKKSILEILQGINQEDKIVAEAVEESLPQIEALIQEVSSRMKKGGRLFYIGAGTSGRLGVLDASECPPTFGVSKGLIVGLIAGGDYALRNAIENAEDDPRQAWQDLQAYDINENDCLIGIAASGRTPYVVGGLQDGNKHGILTGCIVCNSGSAASKEAKFPVEVVVGPEYVTGSTRMKSGTAQKMVLNMITTTLMIQLGKVKGNKMVDMQLSNEKLVERGTRMLMNELGVEHTQAKQLLLKFGNVRSAIDNF